jgi:hypothetical protein
MNMVCRSWWRNCALEADLEMLEIHRLGDEIAPLEPGISRIRELISSLEVCHHKGERWVANIVRAIGTGETNKGLGTRPPGQWQPAEEAWHHACVALSAWRGSRPAVHKRAVANQEPGP